VLPLRSIYPFEAPRFALLWRSPKCWPVELRDFCKGFDRILLWVSGLPVNWVEEARAQDIPYLLVADPNPQPHPLCHHSRYLLETLSPWLEEDTKNPCTLQLRVPFQRGHSSASGSPCIAIHPGSGSPSKNWPAENYVRLIHRLLDREVTERILLFLGPAECQTAAYWKERIRRREVEIFENYSLDKVLQRLASAHIFIGNDSGFSHLAAVLGLPTLAIFGPTDPSIWGPVGERVHILWDPPPCSPCSAPVRRRCPHRMCLQRIGVPDVYQKILSFLSS